MEEIFRDLPFGPDALVSLGRVLESLKGAEISVSGPRSMTGRIASVVVENRRDEDGNVESQHRVALMTAGGLQQFILEDADNISFVDSTLDAQIKDALIRVSERSAQNKRTLVIESLGEGVRTLTIGYVVEVPLWKSSYRLILPPITEKEENLPARLQGWAVLENTSGQNWHDVELTILSGNPVTFRQALYATYYVDRPEVPVEVLGRVLPDPDTGEITERDLKQVGSMEDTGFQAALRGDSGALAPNARREESLQDVPLAVMALSSPGRAAVSDEAATQVVFRLPELVNVSDGESLVVPTIDRTIPAERVSLFVEDSASLNPMAAVKLLNDSETGLPPGVLTLNEIVDERGLERTAYLGDGRLSVLPKGEERVIAYALDEKIQVTSDHENKEQVTTAKIVNGVLVSTTVSEATTVYTIKAPEEEDRILLLDHPQDDGVLVRPANADVAKTANAFRIRQQLRAGETKTLNVVVQWPEQETITLINVDYRTLFAYANNKRLDDATRQAFSRLSQLRAALDAQDRRLADIEKQRNDIFSGQERIRENIKALPANSGIQSRYLRMLDSQEDELEQLAAGESATKSARTQAWQALKDYIESLEV